jgi:hypothetical protein
VGKINVRKKAALLRKESGSFLQHGENFCKEKTITLLLFCKENAYFARMEKCIAKPEEIL